MTEAKSDAETGAEQTIQCMEILGSNRALRQTIHAPGVDLWIDSRPLGATKSGATSPAADGPADTRKDDGRDRQPVGGGDVYYVSMCGGGQVTRLALADVAGHGESVDGIAVFLRKLMRKYINTLDQTRFAQALNQEFAVAAESGRFATAVLATYFAPTRHLILCNAGHGRPLRYSAKRNVWEILDLERAGECASLKQSKVRYHFERLANLPLGILDPIEYEQFAVELEPGDRVLLYTDAVTEAPDAVGELLGEAGLLSLVAAECTQGLAEAGAQLVAALDIRRGTTPAADDQTVIFIEHTGAPGPGHSVLRTASTLAKMVGLRPV